MEDYFKVALAQRDKSLSEEGINVNLQITKITKHVSSFDFEEEYEEITQPQYEEITQPQFEEITQPQFSK